MTQSNNQNPPAAIPIEVKNLFQSKTFWLGILQILAAVAEFIAGAPAGLPIVQIVSGILTIIARIVTSTPIAGTPGARPKV
jgi:hypothetical protein